MQDNHKVPFKLVCIILTAGAKADVASCPVSASQYCLRGTDEAVMISRQMIPAAGISEPAADINGRKNMRRSLNAFSNLFRRDVLHSYENRAFYSGSAEPRRPENHTLCQKCKTDP